MRRITRKSIVEASRNWRNDQAIRRLAQIEDMKSPYIPSGIPEMEYPKADRRKVSYAFLRSIMA